MKNAEGVPNLQPKVVRVSALPWVTKKSFIATLKGLPETFVLIATRFANPDLSGFTPANQHRYPGRCPGLELANVFGVTSRHQQMIRQLYECRNQDTTRHTAHFGTAITGRPLPCSSWLSAGSPPVLKAIQIS